MKLCHSSECTGGFVFDSSQMKLVDCPLCAEIRATQVVEGAQAEDGRQLGLSEKLGIRRIFSRLKVDLKLVLGDLAVSTLDPEIYKKIEDSLISMVSSLSQGVIPRTSLLFYLGVRSDVELLAFWLLGSAYKSGLVTHSFLTPYRLQGIRQKREDYENLMLSDVVVIAYSPSIREDGYLVEDLVRQRAYEGKATFVILTDGSQINNVLQRLGSEDSYSARQYLYVGVPRVISSDEEKIKRTNKVIRNSNRMLNLSTPEVELEEEAVSKPTQTKKGKKQTSPQAVLSVEEASLYQL